MYCVNLPWGSLSACLAAVTHKTMEKPCMETFFLIFACKKNMLGRIFFMFHLFFKIIMKDILFNILQTYKITSKSRHYFQNLDTCNLKPRLENSNQSSFLHVTG